MWLGEFLAKYWLQVFLGLVVTFLTAKFRAIKAWWEGIKNDKEQKKKEERMLEVRACVDELKPMLQDIATKSAEGDEALRAEMNTLAAQVQILKGGVLAIQGDNFKERCRRILNEMDNGQHIDLKTYESLLRDHTAYNALGGNSDGDELFGLVKHRYENQQA